MNETVMKNTKIDLRTRKVYDALIEAFTGLLAEKSFDEITVRELCDRARTRTATFYNHFSDKYEFFAFMIAEKRSDFFANAENIRDDTFEDYCVSILNNSFDFIEVHKEMVQHILSDSLLSVMMNTVSEKLMLEFEKRLQQETLGNDLDAKIMAQLLIGAMSQLTKWWLEPSTIASREEIVEQFSLFLKRFEKE